MSTTPTARGQSFSQLDWSNGWKKIKWLPLMLVILFANALNKINHVDG